MLEADERRYRKAFASYASEDRDAVLARIQGMQKVAPDLDVFLDALALRSGEQYERRLLALIPVQDVFYLFWSEHAKRSSWVEKEWRCAFHTRGSEFIDPVPLVSPRIVPPPPELADKHFDDWVLAFMSGKQGRRRAKRGSRPVGCPPPPEGVPVLCPRPPVTAPPDPT